MLVDRRKDNYDELLVLARDARASRSRTNRWTTGIVVTAMAATGAYVAVMSEQIESLRQARDAADAGSGQLRTELARTSAQLASLQAEHNYVLQNQELLRDMAIALTDNPEIINNLERVGPTTSPESQLTYANLVWVVDGSRRFPMAAADILWIPEGQFWVRMNNPPDGQVKPNSISIFEGSEIGRVDQPDVTVRFSESANGTEYIGQYEQPIAGSGSRGAATCIQLKLHRTSNRTGFGETRYVDMEVLYYTPPESANCGSRNSSVDVTRNR